MRSLEGCYRIAEKENITVDRFPLSARQALSFMDSDGACYIALDPAQLTGETDERTKLCHELGHCITGSFYNPYTGFDCRNRHENRADKWAIRKLIPVSELDSAVAGGCSQLWELAEHFGVTEDFMRKAICFYVHGNLATELYF